MSDSRPSKASARISRGEFGANETDSYKSVQLDNLTLHVKQLPQLIAEAMQKSAQASKTLATAEPSDLVTKIANPQARDFWLTNFGTEIVLAETRLKVHPRPIAVDSNPVTGCILQLGESLRSLRTTSA